MREAFIRLTLNDPQFIQAKPTGKAFVIGGVKPKYGALLGRSTVCLNPFFDGVRTAIMNWNFLHSQRRCTALELVAC